MQADIFSIISISTGLCSGRFHPWLKKLNWTEDRNGNSTNATSMPTVFSSADGPKCYWPHSSAIYLTCFANSKLKKKLSIFYTKQPLIWTHAGADRRASEHLLWIMCNCQKMNVLSNRVSGFSLVHRVGDTIQNSVL